MTAETPLSVLFLWHQHQPLYKDGLKNRYEMPWVRLHATKDYYDMVALLDEFPSIKANFNLVPSLLAQLDDYAEQKAQDRFLELTLKHPSELSFDDRQFILQNFFMAHWEHMIDPYPRYCELLDKRGRMTTPESLSRTQKYFKEQDWRDLQAWFNLTWFDPLWRQTDPFLHDLFKKGKNFTEEDKQRLVRKQLEICAQVVAKHKALQDKGQIEVTTTPFYHPILPLLCDTESARVALPNILLPKHRFCHPEDAREQIKRAVEDYTRRFGQAPQGLWPSEGSVSEEAARLIAESGLRWAATDEQILARSLPPQTYRKELLYEPYRLILGDKDLHLFFRDHELSDAIGFVYASWDPEAAARDFINRLHKIRNSFKDPRQPHVVSVILDGENCWEYYADDGLPFLRALYRQISSDPLLETVRGSDYLNRSNDVKTLHQLWSGSWINSNYAIWIGHGEDNMAWDLLFRTRQFLVDTLQAQPELKASPQAAQAWEEIYIAEGSDWCWWFGEDHSSANDGAFDYLFRRHLMNVYVLLGEKVPDDLHLPIKKKRQKASIVDPVDFIKPVLDGKITGYFEWRSAGYYHTEASGTGTMQKAENLVKSIYFGYDREAIYLRFDFGQRTDPMKGLELRVFVEHETVKEISLRADEDGQVLGEMRDHKKGNVLPEAPKGYLGKYKKVMEIALPLEWLKNEQKQDFKIYVKVLKDGLEQERWPAEATLQIPYPTEDTFVLNWQV